jgi:mRNA interferase YafQ
MRTPVEGTQFRRDVKLAQKRGKDTAKLREAILLLIEGTPLPPAPRPHRNAFGSVLKGLVVIAA